MVHRQRTTIRHACGHNIQHYLQHVPPSERDSERRRLAAKRCHDCQQRDRRDEIEGFNANLVSLARTSDRDVEAAKRVRRVLIPQIERELTYTIAANERAVRVGTMTRCECDKMNDWLRRANECIKRQSKPQWWMRHATDHPCTLLKSYAKRVASKETT